MAIDDDVVRLTVYRSLANAGACPDAGEIAASLGTNEGDVRNRLRRSASSHHLVLDRDDRVVMAHPFATMPRTCRALANCLSADDRMLPLCGARLKANSLWPSGCNVSRRAAVAVPRARAERRPGWVLPAARAV